MKRKNRLLAAVLALAMTFSVISGCDNSGVMISSSEPSSEAGTSVSQQSTTSQAGTDTPDENEPSVVLTDRGRADNGLITKVEALSLDGKCVNTDTQFRVTTNADVAPEELKKRLGVSGISDFTVEKESEKNYLIRPETLLAEGSIVKLQAADDKGDFVDSWAFQTAESFKIKSTYPADAVDFVYTDSGIEIEFSSPVDAGKAKEYFSVSPELKGSFNTHRNTLYFIPDEEMQPNTTYSVEIKAGMPSALSGALEEDYSFSFTTYSGSDSDYFFIYNYNGGRSETYIPGDSVVLEMSCSDKLREKDFTIELYRYDSAEAYSSAQLSYLENGTADTKGLTSVYRTMQKPTPNLVEWRPMFLMLPDDLDEGWYVADISVDNLKQQFFLQVNPISVFAFTLGKEKTFFLNDTKTGKPAVGAEVKLTADGKTYTAKADSDGLAKLTTDNGEGEWGTLDISYGTSRYIDAFYTAEENEPSYDSLYYMYLYTDREAYLTSDTISVWGVIRPRFDGVTVPKNVSLRLGRSETEGETKEVKVNSDGTFTTSFTYTNHAESYYVRLSMLDGDKLMHQKSVQIRDYVKPSYVFDVELPDYVIMPHRDVVPMDITAQFFEGTPAKGLMFDANAKSCTPSILKTDENGYVHGDLLFEDDNTWRLSSAYLNVQLTGVENEYSYEYFSIPAFYRDVMLETDYDKTSRTLTFNTTQLDFSKMEEFLADYEMDYDILKGKPFDTTLSIRIDHYWSERVEDGTYYDYIEKRNVTTFHYEDREEYIGNYSVNAKNGVGKLTDLPLTSDKGYYSVQISYKDSLGQSVFDRYNIYNGDYIYYYYRNPNYLYYELTAEENEDWEIAFTENSSIDFTLKCNDEAVSANCGRVFFVTYQDDFITQRVYNSAQFSYSPTLDCIPNARYDGAYFDGKHIYPVSGNSIIYNPEERNISLEVTTDKATYDAGETAQLTVKAVDENGRAVSGAAVQLSVVDEAAFAVAPQEVTFLDDVYRFVYYPFADNYYSYIQHVMDGTGMGEMGGGGDDFSVRKDFKDTAYFDAKTTGADGTAKFTVKLADNLTTWRATVHAVKETQTGRVYAGHRTHPIVATRPLFVTPIMLDTFIEGDDIAVTAKCQGLDKNDVITVNIKGSGVDKTLKVGSAKTANFGKLPAGEYKVLFTAEKNGNKDAIELPLTVTDTILETDISNAFDLAEGIDITPTKWPVRMTFFDKEYMFYTDILRSLTSHYGDRTERRIASSFAYMQLGFMTEEEFINEFSSLTYDGFARELPAAQASAKLTALMAVAAPELVNRAAVIPEFENIVDSEKSDAEEVCIAYMGLAALGEPVLEEVREILASGKLTNYFHRMYLVAALALCGDYDTAYDYYVEYTPNIVMLDSDAENVSAYVGGSSTLEQEQTKLALITAAILKLPEAEWFARYLISDDEQYDSYAMELMVYLNNYVPKVEGDAVFTYNINGRTETVELDRHWGYTMSFGEEQYRNADFTVTSGAVYVVTDYIGRMEEQSKPASMNVTKTLTGDFTQGGLVKVTIRTSAYSLVDDVIPSCGRYVEKADNCLYRSGQRVSLYTGMDGTASYYFRVTTEGDYVVEGALAQDYKHNWGVSERDTITIKFENETA